MYRLGVSCTDSSAARDADADADLRNSFLNPTVRHPYDAIDDASMYDPANFLPPFGDRSRDESCRYGV